MSTKPIRFAADTGGTFTDLVVDEEGELPKFYKRPTTPHDPAIGLFDALNAVAEDFDTSIDSLLSRSDSFIFGTTVATNAIVTGSVAKTALLVTSGHPDILLLREGGGRKTLFGYSQKYPEPFVPRYLTFEVDERMSAEGKVVKPMDESQVLSILDQLRDLNVEAIAVSLLWSIVDGSHERRLGEMIEENLPGIPYTLSNRLNPSIREYRRTSSACIDASLKPLMSTFLKTLDKKFRANGFGGRLLVMTSSGGVQDADAVAEVPIHSIGSGPAGAPVAGRHFASRELGENTAIVVDAGGTTFDVSLIRDDALPTTRETMVGDQVVGYMTGFPSVDVKSIGAGGGSIAWVDEGGLLQLGPMSAGADPGPACYNKGGERPTVTDAGLVLGYIDPDYFLGGTITVEIDLAIKAIQKHVADPLKLDVNEAASAILRLAIERMANAIEDITLNQGLDPEQSMLIGGGGGAGLYCAAIAQRLNSWPVLIPGSSAALSATGAILSDLRSTFMTTEMMSTKNMDMDKANAILSNLVEQSEQFINGPGTGSIDSQIKLFVEARYPHQVWEIEVPLRRRNFTGEHDVHKLVSDFHRQHDLLFAVVDEDSDVEIVSWGATVSCKLREEGSMEAPTAPGRTGITKERDAYFPEYGIQRTKVLQVEDLEAGVRYTGPLLVESPVTTLVIDNKTSIEYTKQGSILINPI